MITFPDIAVTQVVGKVWDPVTLTWQTIKMDASTAWDVEQLEFPFWNPPTEQVGCWHVWKEYVGFSEKYRFCTKCDEKEFLNE